MLDLCFFLFCIVSVLKIAHIWISIVNKFKDAKVIKLNGFH